MKPKRDLERELTGCPGTAFLPPCPDTAAITRMVFDGLSSDEKGVIRPMKKMKTALVACLAAVVVLALGLTAFAISGRVTMISGYTSSTPDYRTLPTENRCEKDAGFAPVLLPSFENGYTFQNGHLVRNELIGEGDTVLEHYGTFSFTYEKDGDTVDLTQERHTTEMPFEGEAVATAPDGTKLYYTVCLYKLVPTDYEPTEEEQAQEADGLLTFGYAAACTDVAVYQLQNLSWQQGDRYFSLFQMDGALTQDELIEMAQEILKTT